MSRKILFISHDANRAGAPILMLRLARGVADTGIGLTFFVNGTGPLLNDFKAVGPTLNWRPDRKAILTRLLDKVYKWTGLNHFTSEARHLKKLKSIAESCDAIFMNTVWSAALLKKLQPLQKPVITYVHELAVMTAIKVSNEDMAWINEVSDKVLVPAHHVKEFLVNRYSFDKTKIGLLKYIIPEYQEKERTSLTAPGKVFHAGACGTLDWRKGCDVFLSIARKIILHHHVKDIHFTWLGANLESIEYKFLMEDIHKCGLADFITIQPSTQAVEEYFASWDVFLLPSREDAFPLVALEAAAVGIPTVYFRDAGGIGEFLHEDAGTGIDYLDIDQFCEAVLDIKNDASVQKQKGETARARISSYTQADSIVESFLQHIKSL